MTEPVWCNFLSPPNLCVERLVLVIDSPEAETYIAAQLSTGQFASAGEVLIDALSKQMKGKPAAGDLTDDEVATAVKELQSSGKPGDLFRAEGLANEYFRQKYSKKRLPRLMHDLIALAALGYAAYQMAMSPAGEPGVLMFLVPVAMASTFHLCDTGRFNPVVLFGCRLFLDVVVVAVLIAQLPFLLPSLKPQFPGLLPSVDRTFVFYIAAFGMFFWVFCPAYLLGTSLFAHLKGVPGGMNRWILYAGCLFWVGTMIALFASIILYGRERLFL
jgi:hypothetical protein